jgi:hypothetical protein
MFHFPHLRSPRRPTILERWAYFGSFGDDFFSVDAEAASAGLAGSDEAK